MRRNKQHGFTLIEILITIIILAIGLLGLAGMQLQGMRFNHSAYLRTQASLYAYDMLDRMRSNRTTALTTGAYLIGVDEEVSMATNCTTNNCTGSQMANFDLAEWKVEVQNLPEGKGGISFEEPGDGSRIYVVEVQWSDFRGDADEDPGEDIVQIFRYRGEL
jgi:type IV pilus assembly protein PilV